MVGNSYPIWLGKVSSSEQGQKQSWPRSSSRSCCLEILMVNPEYTSKTLLLYHSFLYCGYFSASPGSLCFGPNVVPKKSPLFQADG
jgi:hypothetical protein